jgi:hypothetical protein
MVCTAALHGDFIAAARMLLFLFGRKDVQGWVPQVWMMPNQVRWSRLLLQLSGRLLQWPEAMLTALSGMHAGADQQTSLPRCTVAVRMETEHAARALCITNSMAHTLKRA